jgi:hypothetical protein
LSATTRCARPSSRRAHSPRDDAGDEVEREQPLGARPLLVDGERDALHQERPLDDLLLLLDLLCRGRAQVGGEPLAVRRGTPAEENISS